MTRAGQTFATASQVCMSGEDVEVRVGVQDLGSCSDRHRGDEAVDELADGFATNATGAVERSRSVIVRRCRRQHRGPAEQSAKLCEMVFAAGTGEDFHRHGIADGRVVSDQAIDCVARRRTGVAKELDPRRGVDEDHTLLARISSRSPSHPDPRSARAWSTPRGSPASRCSARLTASRLVVRW